MIKYRATSCFNTIEEIEVVGETKCFIILNICGREQRESKRGSFRRYFDTHEEAYNYLESELKRKIRVTKRRLKISTKDLEELKQKYGIKN